MERWKKGQSNHKKVTKRLSERGHQLPTASLGKSCYPTKIKIIGSNEFNGELYKETGDCCQAGLPRGQPMRGDGYRLPVMSSCGREIKQGP